MGKLQVFGVAINELTGKIPDLSGLTNLKSFDVHNNRLTGSIPTLGSLTNIQSFGADFNQLTGSIPDLTGLIKLQGFSVHDNRLTGPIPALATLANLKVFNVSFNQLSGSIPAAPPSLTHASLCPNALTIASQPDIDPVWNKATGATHWWSKSSSPESKCETASGETAAAQNAAGAKPKLDERALALRASLAATGNDYPKPALFVQRWNLLTQWDPESQITKFTSRGHENDPRPIADLDGFDFVSAESTYLQIGSSGVSVEYVTVRNDPINIGAMERPNAYSITISGDQKRNIGNLCIWLIQSTRSSFTLRSAIQLFGDAVHFVPPSSTTDSRKHAEAEGISLTVRHRENETCEVKQDGSS